LAENERDLLKGLNHASLLNKPEVEGVADAPGSSPLQRQGCIEIELEESG
jgi:hypothetical protein